MLVRMSTRARFEGSGAVVTGAGGGIGGALATRLAATDGVDPVRVVQRAQAVSIVVGASLGAESVDGELSAADAASLYSEAVAAATATPTATAPPLTPRRAPRRAPRVSPPSPP